MIDSSLEEVTVITGDDMEHLGSHLGAMFNAAEEVLVGSVGMPLSEAQQYAEGVLGCNNVHLTSRRGNEGFLDSVSDGFKKIWAYIVKTVKSIWDFFFVKEEPAQAKAVDEEIKLAEKIINELKKEVDVDNRIDSMFKDIPDIEANAAAAFAAIKQKRTVKGDEVAELFIRGKMGSLLVLQRSKYTAHVAFFEAVINEGNKLADSHDSQMNALKSAMEGVEKDIAGIKTVSDIKTLLGRLRSLEKAMISYLNGVKADRVKVKGMMNSIESGSKDGKMSADTKDKLGPLKDLLVLFTKVIHRIGVIREDITKTAKYIKTSFAKILS